MAKSSRPTPNRLTADDDWTAWDRFVDRSPQGCIFCRSWWLDAMCGGRAEVLVLRKGDHIVAGMPLPLGRKAWWSTLTMPPLTQTLGVLLEPEGEGKEVTRLANETAVLRALVDAIPKVDFFRISFHHAFTNWLPFHWAGYEQTTRYTYVIDDLSDLDAVRDNFAPQLRTKLRKAEKSGIRVEPSDDLELLIELNRKTFAHRGSDRPYSEAELRALFHACAQHDARTLLIARDAGGRAHAALCVVHDGRCMYNLVGGTDPELRQSGANHLALWRALELAHRRGVAFDFCGSMLEGVESFNRSFGGRQARYFTLSRCRSFTARAASLLRDLIGHLRGREG
jgi:lipid II:glycine glycyltransferase (peptidoglycan interpeptide bridge formation enzyme)